MKRGSLRLAWLGPRATIASAIVACFAQKTALDIKDFVLQQPLAVLDALRAGEELRSYPTYPHHRPRWSREARNPSSPTAQPS